MEKPRHKSEKIAKISFFSLTARASFVFLAGAMFTIFLWFSLAQLIASNRGLELTDEGLYLLAAQAIAGKAHWGFPNGWHTAPLFALVGYDLANFRTAGAVVLAVTGMTFGFTAFLATYAPPTLMSCFSERRFAYTGGLFGLVGLLSSLFYYSALLRAPSYNWVNLVGLLVAGTGFFFYLWQLRTHQSTVFLSRATVGIAVIAGGLIFTVVAKPSSPILFMLVAIVLVAGLAGPTKALAMATYTALFGATMIVLLILLRFWPLDFLEFFLGPLGAPTLLPSQSLRGAVENLIGFPFEFVSRLTNYGAFVTAVILGGLVLLGLSRWFPQRGPTLFWLGIGAGFVSAMWIFGFSEWVFLDFSPQYRWVTRSAPMAAFILLLIAAIAGASRVTGGTAFSSNTHGRFKLAVAVMAVWIPFVFGFGSGHGVLRQSGLALIGVFVGAFVLLPPLRRQNSVLTIWSSLLAALLTMLSLTIFDSHRDPYRLSAVTSQTVEIVLRDKGQSRIFVQNRTAQSYLELTQVLDQAGYSPGDPVIGLVWRWNSTWPYAVGAEVPPSLMPTLWGSPTSTFLLENNLALPNRTDFDWEGAWWFVSNPDSIGEEERNLLEEAYGLMRDHVGRNFPNGYEFVGTAGSIDVYRPR